jgi:hypothetical protein
VGYLLKRCFSKNLQQFIISIKNKRMQYDLAKQGNAKNQITAQISLCSNGLIWAVVVISFYLEEFDCWWSPPSNSIIQKRERDVRHLMIWRISIRV